jgi:hypothetical protein
VSFKVFPKEETREYAHGMSKPTNRQL